MRVLACAVIVAAALQSSAAVTGTVVGENGEPLANVRVVAAGASPPLLRLSVAPKPPLASATTNDKGEFTLAINGNRIIDIQVRHDGFAPVDKLVLSGDSAGVIALRTAAMVSGRVTASGKPVANARVFVMSGASTFETTTDAEGKYRAPDPEKWSASLIVVVPSDFASVFHTATARDFEVVAGRSVTGTVVDANGKPVAGAAVSVRDLLNTTSGPDGSFHFDHVPDSPLPLRATFESQVATAVAHSQPITLKLQPAARIRGVVRDENKQPVAGLLVMLMGMNAQEAVLTDANGAFVTTPLPRAQYQIAAMAGDLYSSADDTVIDARGGDVQHDVVASRHLAIDGRVTGDDGLPVANAALISVITSDGMPATAQETGAVSGADGRFHLASPMTSEAGVRVVALKPGLPPAFSEPIAKGRAVAIKMSRGVEVRGVLVDADHKPLAGVRIDPMLVPSMPGMRLDVSLPAWATTTADGHFIARLATGKIALRFAKSGYIATDQEIDVAANGKPVEVALARGAELRGHVVDSHGKGVAEAPVMVDQQMTMTAGDGSFSFDAVTPGPVHVMFGQSMKEQVVTAPATALRLIVPASKKIRGKVTDAASGEPIAHFTVATAEMGQPFESGEFELDVDDAAENVTIRATGYVAAIVPVAEKIVTSLSRGRKVRGRVTDEKGQPLAGATVSIGDSNEPAPQAAPDGSYEATGIPFDTDAVVTYMKEGFTKTQRGVKRGHDDVTLDVVMLRGVTITGRVVDASGNGVAAANVTATSAAVGADNSFRVTDEHGAFQFDDLLPARYDFVAQSEHEGVRGSAKDVDLAQVHELIIHADKREGGTIRGHVAGISTATRGVMVAAMNDEGDHRTASPDANGNFTIANAPAGAVTVNAMAIGGAAGFRTSNKVTVDVVTGSEAQVELVFASQVGVHGRVTTNGAPLPNVTVNFSGENDTSAPTSADGTYQTTMDPGEYNVTLSANSHSLPFSQHVVVKDASAFDFNVDGATIIATVIDAGTNQPIAGASVTTSKRGETHTMATATTGSDGKASLDVARGDVVTVIASHRGHANASQDVSAGDAAAVTLALHAAPGAVVRIVDVRDGRTLSGYVIARDPSGRVVASSDETDPDGTSTLPLAEGAYQVSASAEGYGSHTVNAQIPSGEIRVPLPRGGSLSLRTTTHIRGSARLIQPDGQPYVRCWCSGIAEITIASPATLVDRIAPGAYTLEITPVGMKSKQIPVTVIEGQTVNVSLD